jgi:2-polyprenyl-3-methyl-5-hydroxy-6-metoxy-1,4-benzoquinol methylase
MSYDDFVALYAADVKRSAAALLDERPLSFPISTNQRGRAFVDFLTATLDIELAGKRVLDIGCAYGGMLIALAEAQAKVSGIDVSPKFINYAKANVRGTADVDLQVLDASSIAIRENFPKKSFDLIILHDVLEHIYDTTRLISNIDYLLADEGVVYFKVPNGLSPRFILSEGHRKIFGLSLLDPDCWFYLYPKRASIFYRPLEYFEALFKFFEMPQLMFVDHEDVFRRFTVRKLKNQIKEVFQKARDYEYPDAYVKPILRHSIVRFRDEYGYDLQSRDEDYIKFKYGSYFYVGFAGRPNATLRPGVAIRDVDGVGTIAMARSLTGVEPVRAESDPDKQGNLSDDTRELVLSEEP